MSETPTPETEPAPATPPVETTPPAEAVPAAVDTTAPTVVDAPAVAEPVVAEPVVAEPAAAPTRRGSVQVPVWVLIVVTVVVVGVGAFFVGRETAPSSGDSGPKTLAEAVQETASGEMEVGSFDLRTLLQALAQNPDLNLGSLGDLILGQGGRN